MINITVKYSFKRKFIGYSVTSDLIEMSIHKGLTAWGVTKRHAIYNLHKKWNDLVNKDFVATKEQFKNNPNIEIEQISFNWCEKI